MPATTREYNQLRAAKEWRKDPAGWRACTVDDRALMLAVVLYEGVLEAYRQEWRERPEEEKNRESGNRESGNGGMFSAMKARMRGDG